MYFDSSIIAEKTKRNTVGGGGVFIASLLVLTLAYLAVVARLGANTGDLQLWNLFALDEMRPWMIFQDAFLRDGYPIGGWQRGVAPLFFPDFAIAWLLFAFGLDFRAVHIIFPFCIALVSIGGWCFVCDELFGFSWRRRAVVVLLHVLPFSLIAFGTGADVFVPAFKLVHHYGTWVVILWIIGCYLRILRLDIRRPQARPYIIAAVLLTTLTAGSDLLLLIWLTAPALFALTLMLWRRQSDKGELLGFAAISAVSVPLGVFLTDLIPGEINPNTDNYTSFNLDRAMMAAEYIAIEMGNIAVRNPLTALLWMAGTAMLLWRFFDALKQPANHAEQPEKGYGLGERSFFSLTNSNADLGMFSVPRERTAVFIALFIPASAASGIAAVIATGNIYFPPWIENEINLSLRYHLPFVHFPLFIGWALCNWRAGLKQADRLGFAAVISLAALSIAQLAWSADGLKTLNVYASPFHRCFAAAAQRLNWRGGIMTYPYTLQLASNPDADIERTLPVGVVHQGDGKSRLYVAWTVTSRHHFSGDFQFVVVNYIDNLFFISPPVSENYTYHACVSATPAICAPTFLILNDAAARDMFGEPAEVVTCAGVGLYHYDPPIETDFLPPDQLRYSTKK